VADPGGGIGAIARPRSLKKKKWFEVVPDFSF